MTDCIIQLDGEQIKSLYTIKNRIDKILNNFESSNFRLSDNYKKYVYGKSNCSLYKILLTDLDLEIIENIRLLVENSLESELNEMAEINNDDWRIKMAKTVSEELREKLSGAIKAKEETDGFVKRYLAQQKILSDRIDDLKFAINALEKFETGE